MKTEYEILVEDLILLAASAQSGIDVTPIRLIAEIRRKKPYLATVSISQVIDNLDDRSFGSVRPAPDDAGEREFFIDHNGVSFAQVVAEERRTKSLVERLKIWTRTDWFAFGALVISMMSLVVSILALQKSGL